MGVHSGTAEQPPQAADLGSSASPRRWRRWGKDQYESRAVAGHRRSAGLPRRPHVSGTYVSTLSSIAALGWAGDQVEESLPGG
ncbi:hypothetical protein [Amycolatopsis sp. cmx-11-51]|uniref:hypothetical protein n=1 Tax=Amycolatopsis sp. cmx-11-51 TaxID=2785797 RepID=UPI0039E34451